MARELTHYGVRGMKWGVRKARTGDLNVKASRLERVSKGEASVVDKLTTVGGSTAFNLVRSGGLKNEAARRATKYRAEEKRLATGKAKATDVLKAYGTASVLSLAASKYTKNDHDL